MCGGGPFRDGGPATKLCPPLTKILCAPLARSGQRTKWPEVEVAKGSVIGQGEGRREHRHSLYTALGIANQPPRQGGWSERRAEPRVGVESSS